MPVLDRERRSTAGRRMNDLAGQEAEDDAAFWGHDTWNEDSDNESFHSSDEDSEVKKDVFDSDFDESESDREEEEAAAGDEEDKLIARGDKKRKESNYSDVVAGKQQHTARGKRMKGVKRVVGHGLNAGIVLNAPGSVVSVPISLVSSAAAVVANRSSQAAIPEPKVSIAAARLRRTDVLPKPKPRTTRADASSTATNSASQAAQPSLTTSSTQAPQKKKKRHRHTQEELLLEAARETEGENARWLLARKRYQEEQKTMKEDWKEEVAAQPEKGYLNTITFPEMDHVPEILTRRESPVTKPLQTLCVITGLKARYRDPRTGLGYYDAAAFKELRRRSDAGEPLDQRNTKATVAKEKSNTASISESNSSKPHNQASKPAISTAPKKPAENGKVINKRKIENPQAVSHSEVTQAPEPSTSQPTAGPVASTNAIRHASPRRRKPSTKALASRDADILTNGSKTVPPVRVSPSRPLQETRDSLTK